MMDEGIFQFEEDLQTSSLPDVQYCDASPQNAPVEHLTTDTKDLMMGSPEPFSFPRPLHDHQLDSGLSISRRPALNDDSLIDVIVHPIFHIRRPFS